MRNLFLAVMTASVLGYGVAHAACPIPNPNNTPMSSGGFVDGCTLSAAGLNEIGGIFSAATGNHSQIGPTPLAAISRMGDRLFVGKNTNVNGGGFSNQISSTKDWMETIRVDTTSEAIIAAISTDTLLGTGGGGISVLGAQRTSDQGSHHPSEVESVVGFCIGDTAATEIPNLGDPGCWAGYFETRKNAVARTTTVYGIEIDMTQYGTSSISVNPYGVLTPGGATGVVISSGGGDNTTLTADTALMIAQNPSKWMAGLVFQSLAISGSNGSDAATCCANAIQLARDQAISFWASPDGNTGQAVGLLYSSAQSGHHTVNIDLINEGLQIENNQTGIPLGYLVQGNMVIFAGAPPVACGGGGGTTSALTVQGTACNQFLNIVQDVTNNKAILQVGAGNSGFEISGLPSVSTGTGKHLLCIDPSTKFVYEGTGATCS